MSTPTFAFAARTDPRVTVERRPTVGKPARPAHTGLPILIRANQCVNGVDVCHAGCSMRDSEIIETELMEISAIAEDTVKFERIVAWCATHPDEVPFALHQFLGQGDKRPSEPSET